MKKNRKKVLIATIAIAAMSALLLGGCGEKKEQPETKSTSEVKTTEEVVVVVKKDFDGGVLLSDETGFTILLDGNPTTGYQWDQSVVGKNLALYFQHTFAGQAAKDVLDPNSADLSEYASKKSADASKEVGKGSCQGYMMGVLGTGKSSAVFTYHRPWEAAVEKVVTVTAEVEKGILKNVDVNVASAADGKITVPNVVTFTKSDAVNVMKQIGLQVGDITEEFSDTVQPGLVISQNPAAGSSINMTDKVSLVISKGPQNAQQVQVPDLIGKNPVDAEKALRDAGLVPDEGYAENSDSIPAGNVCNQSVEAGKSVAVGTVVTYNLSVGQGTVEMPNVVGMHKEDAIAVLQQAGFQVNTDKAYSATIETGDVIMTSPRAGTKLEAGQTVDITVSMGPEPPIPTPEPTPTPEITTVVPKITEMSWVKALKALQDAGLQVGTISFDNQLVGAKPQFVVKQSLQEGTEVSIGTSVDFTVFGENPDPVTTPTAQAETPES